LGLTQEEFDRLSEAIGAALDGCVMTREELAQEGRRLTGSGKFATKLAYGGWSTILKPAAMTGRLCFGPSVGQRVRFYASGNLGVNPVPQMDSQSATASLLAASFQHMARHLLALKSLLSDFCLKTGYKSSQRSTKYFLAFPRFLLYLANEGVNRTV
jgi:hypothetical protein